MTDHNIVVFSQSTPFDQILALIQNCANALPFLCMSTQKLFDLEEVIISEPVNHPVRFACFADFLSDEEMAWCDTHAYELEAEGNVSKLRSPSQYYEYIKAEKNKLVLKNVGKQYQLAEKYLCADDLGIAADVWLEEGFSSQIQQEQQVTAASPAAAMTLERYRSLRLQISRNCRHIGDSFKRVGEEISVLQTPVGDYVFLGSTTRIRPRLDNVGIQTLQPGLIARLVNLLLVLTPGLLTQPKKTILSRLQSNVISRHYAAQHELTLLSTMHEYQPGHSELAHNLNMDLVILQDGFLPENYTSRYLAYYIGVREFWVWDRLSLGLFENQGFKAEVCEFLSVPKLPEIERDQYPVRTIVVLTSGAGDWTALKNRSDEDQMVMAFVKVAEHFPDVQIIYRCHPLWAHPAHQGINSILRVKEYFRRRGLKNIMVSEESLTQSRRFMERGELGFPQSSLAKDLGRADLVFGEHSYTMIDAARQHTLFASVNLTRRRNFFESFTKLGFPHLTSTEEIISFIGQLQASPDHILQSYNKAIQCYNNQWWR